MLNGEWRSGEESEVDVVTFEEQVVFVFGYKHRHGATMEIRGLEAPQLTIIGFKLGKISFRDKVVEETSSKMLEVAETLVGEKLVTIKGKQGDLMPPSVDFLRRLE
ncbi:hypothetical protein PIB30_053201 [Stylosanthes scabra]|uniref:Uncharacterized protein n=1 Tax=Stylosanthes scabra TaxID=79078 RepID=A0ABU6ZH66_9FABA|nr:hypothetical protein [Stylosanthes scabra]